VTNPNPAYKKNVLAGLAVPTSVQDPQLRNFLAALKQHIELAHGNKGQPKSRFVTLDDLAKAGLATIGVIRNRGEIVSTAETTTTSVASTNVTALGNLDDVNLTNAAEGSVLRYNALANVWEDVPFFGNDFIADRFALPDTIAYEDEVNFFQEFNYFQDNIVLSNDVPIRWISSSSLERDLLKLNTTGGDFYFNNVQMLCDFDGTDAATSYTEQSNIGASFTFAGNAQLDTAIFKYGTAALLLDGAGDYIFCSDNTGYTLGTSDFTIEAWINLASLPNASSEGGMCIMGHWITAVNQRAWYFGFDTSDKLQFSWTTDGTNVQSVETLNAMPITVGGWHHVAVVRDGANLRLYFDGIEQTQAAGGDSISGDSLFNSSNTMQIGRLHDSAGNWQYVDGSIDNLRFTVGVARYATNFTVPQDEFPTTTGDNEFEIGNLAHKTRMISPQIDVEASTVRLIDGSTFTITDSTNADSMVMDHDGDDFNITYTNTDIVLSTGAGSRYEFDQIIRMQVDPTKYIEMFHDDPGTQARFGTASDLRIFSGGTVMIEQGDNFRVLGGIGLDYGNWQHDGTDFNLTFANTTNYNISGAVPVRLRGGSSLEIWDSGNTDHVDFSHDGTDFNIAATNTANINITGIAALVFGNYNFDVDQAVGAGQDNYVMTYDNGDGQLSLEAHNQYETVTVTDTDSGFTWAATGSIVASGLTDTATLVSGTDIDIDVDAASDAIRISMSNASGFATISGTPSDDQIAVWTGGTAIEGTSGLTKTATQFTAGNYVFNTDQTVGVGEDNYILTYDNASGEIGLEAAAGGGNVSNTGTPADDQIAVWTSATVIEGTSGLTKSATQFTAGNYTFNTDQAVGAGQDNFVLTYDNASGEISLEASAAGSTLASLTDTDITTPADASILIYDTGTGDWRDALLSGDVTITDTGVATVADNSHNHLLSNVTDVTASVAEVNLLDLSGLTVGWVLRASGAATAAWAQLDHTDLGSVGSNTHAQIDTHIADSTIHFTEASIDHGSITGLGDDDHPQYGAIATTETISGAWKFTATHLEVESTEPRLLLEDTDAAADEKAWLLREQAGLFGLYTATDAAPTTVVNAAFTTDRTGTTVDNVTFPPNVDFSSGIDVTGNITVTGTVDGKDVAGHVDDTTIHFTKGSILLEDLGDVTETTITTGDLLRWNGSAWVNYADSNYAASSHTHLLAAGATDVTATAAEVNLLDLAGLTAGWVLRASGAATAAWAQLAHGDLSAVGSNTHAQIDTHIGDATIHFTKGSILLDDLGDVTETTITTGDVLRWNGSAWVNYADSNFAASSHTHLLAAGATDVTATAAEVNLLDLSGLTAGWALIADTATTASWQAITESDISDLQSYAVISGTPADNQLAIWTSATDIEGQSNLTYGALSNFRNSGNEPRYELYEADAAADEKLWRMVATGGDLYIQTRTDADAAGQTFMGFVRGTGTAVDRVVLNDGTDFRINDSTNADSVSFSHDGTDLNVEFVGTTDFNIFDGVELMVWDSTDTDNISLRHNGSHGFIETNATGGEIILNSALGNSRTRRAGNTDTEQNRHKFEYNDGTLRGFVGYNSTSTLELRQQVHGGAVQITAEDNATGAPKILFLGDPDNNASIWYNGNARVVTQSTSTACRRNDSVDTSVIAYRIQHANATNRMLLGYIGDGNLVLRNEVHGNTIAIQGEDGGGNVRVGFSCDPDDVTFVRGDTSVEIQVTTSATVRIEVDTTGIGFFGATPVAQPSGTGETTGFTAGTGTGVNDDSTFTGNVGSTAYRISDIVKHLKNLGLIAS
jgi:hypothetical protein